MEKVRFNRCLNKETKFYNISIGTLIGGAALAFVALIIKGLVWSFFAGGIGAYFGQWLGNQWWLGNIQRWAYWHLPLGTLFFKANIPASDKRNLI